MFRNEQKSEIFRTICDASPVGMVIMGKSGKILHANGAFYGMMGIPGEDDSNLNISACVVEDDRAALMNAIGALSIQHSKSRVMELRYELADVRGWMRLNAYSCRYPWMDDIFIAGLIEEISERKAEEARMLSDKEEAERATQTKSDFLANMSHEIRTPLHTITGMAELIQETQLDAEQFEYADQISFSADVLLSLINDILDFSKIEAGRLSLERIEFDLHKTIQDSVDLVALEAHKKGLEVLIDIGSDVPRFLLGDPTRIRQVVLNLFNNAMKFTSKGEIGIKLETAHRDGSKTEIRISVKDTGIGIPADKISRLFKVFSQVDSSTTRKYGGSGLGLSISRNLVQIMNGTIGVESDEGEGSLFWFLLPLEEAESEARRRGEGEPFTPGLRALVVDDNQSCRHIVGSYLKAWGFEVEGAQGGAQALVMLRNAARVGVPFDLCLIDQFMPGIDGWHLASEINADPPISETLLFLMSPTGKTGDEAKMKLLNWFEGYISKPVKKDDIFDSLSRVLAAPEELEPLEEVEETEEEGFSFVGSTQPVLVAEDHEVNQYLFRTILQNLGIPVVVASNGKDAIELAKNGVSLIFMDVQMPEINGYEATEKIRSLGIDVPIVAVTASAVKGERDHAIEVGMTDFLTKPFKKHDLIPVLRKWLPVTTSNPAYKTVDNPEDDYVADRDIFDFDEAVDTFMGNREMVINLVATLREKTSISMEEIERGFQENDMGKIRSAAHAVKGSSLNLAVVRMGSAAASLEDAASAGNRPEAMKAFVVLRERHAEFLDYCRKYTAE